MSVLPKRNDSTAIVLVKLIGLLFAAVIVWAFLNAIVIRVLGVDPNLMELLKTKSNELAANSNTSPNQLENSLTSGANQLKAMMSKLDVIYIYTSQISYNLIAFFFVGLLFRKSIFQTKSLRTDWKKNDLHLYFLCFAALFTSLPLLAQSLQLNELFGFNKLNDLFGIDLATNSLANMIFGYAVFMPSTGQELFFSLVGAAIIPAIGEELFFRGGLQKFLVERFKNPHNAIFITSFIFSVVHFDITAFFYRFFLGVILGYIYFWGRTIWLPILLHFLNNGMSMIVTYLQNSTTLFSEEDLANAEQGNQTIQLLFSSLLLGLILWSFYNNYKKYKNLNNDLDESKRLT